VYTIELLERFDFQLSMILSENEDVETEVLPLVVLKIVLYFLKNKKICLDLKNIHFK